MRLLIAEVRRLSARRAVRWLVLVLFGALAVVLAGAAGRVLLPPAGGPAASFRFVAQTGRRMTDFGGALALLGFVVGATAAGAEWSAGTMPVLLTWRPRRARVIGAKASAVALVLAAVGLLTMGLIAAAHYELTALTGSFADVGRAQLGSLGLLALRGTALGCAAGLAGFALAMIFRGTAAPLTVALTYVVGDELVARALWRPAPPWLLSINASAWLGTRADGVTYAHSAAYLGTLVVAALLAATVLFGRRDVT